MVVNSSCPLPNVFKIKWLSYLGLDKRDLPFGPRFGNPDIEITQKESD